MKVNLLQQGREWLWRVGQRDGHDGIVVLGFHAKCQVAEHVTPVCSFPTCNIGLGT